MVVMFVELSCWGRRAFPYYSYRKNPTGREFFALPPEPIGVKLLKKISKNREILHRGCTCEKVDSSRVCGLNWIRCKYWMGCRREDNLTLWRTGQVSLKSLRLLPHFHSNTSWNHHWKIFIAPPFFSPCLSPSFSSHQSPSKVLHKENMSLCKMQLWAN